MRHLAGFGLIVVVACSSSRQAAAIEDADLARGKAIIGDLKKSLVGALTQAMGEGVPQAISVCNTEAPRLAAAAAHDGVVLGRATRLTRNPSNVATGWQVEAIAHFEQLRANGTALAGQTFSRRLSGDRVAYAEPLVIQPLCLPCHGQDLAPAVQTAIAERYPEDRATGYAEGDLRGIAWVELPKR